MPAAYPPEFRRRAMDLVRSGEPVTKVAKDLGIAESGLRRWLDRDDVDAGRKEGLTSEERKEARRRGGPARAKNASAMCVNHTAA